MKNNPKKFLKLIADTEKLKEKLSASKELNVYLEFLDDF